MSLNMLCICSMLHTFWVNKTPFTEKLGFVSEQMLHTFRVNKTTLIEKVVASEWNNRFPEKKSEAVSFDLLWTRWWRNQQAASVGCVAVAVACPTELYKVFWFTLSLASTEDQNESAQQQQRGQQTIARSSDQQHPLHFTQALLYVTHTFNLLQPYNSINQFTKALRPLHFRPYLT